MSEQKRVVCDFEIDFSNGGGLQGQEFRLDIDGDDISDDELAAYLVRDLRLLKVGAVRIRHKQIITEPHQRPPSDPDTTIATILELEAEGRAATLANDIEAEERLLADSWLNTNANGSLITKPQLLGLMRRQPFKFASIQDDEVRVQVYGQTAIVSGRSTRVRESADGTQASQRLRFTRVYVQLPEGWRIVAAHATPIV